MTQTFLFILVISIGLYYANKYGSKAEKNIKNLTQKSEPKEYSSMLLWEDDYLMAEVISSNNLNFAKKQIGEITNTSELKKIDTKELEISKTELSELLKNAKLNEYETISYPGIGETKILNNTKTRAFGDLNSAIFFDGDTDKVEHIWLSSQDWEKVNNTNILNGLNAIGIKYNMILLDIYPIQNKIVDLKDKTKIQNYLDVYVKRFSNK